MLLLFASILILERTESVGSEQIKLVNTPSTDFQGNEISNVALTNATINGHLQHLAVDSLEIQSERSDLAGGTRVAAIDHRGGLSTIPHVKWDDTKNSLVTPGLSSSSGTIAVHSDIDLQSKTMRNFRMEQNTILSNIILEGGIVRDSILANVSFENLTLGVITVDRIQISSIKNDPGKSAFILVGDDGIAKGSDAIQETKDGIVMKKKVHFEVPLNLEENVKAREIEIETLRLSTYLNSKRHITDALVSIDANGVLQSANLTLEDGWIEHAKFTGDIHFRDGDNRQGKIVNAIVEGGIISDIEELSVEGQVNCKSGLRVHEDAFIDGSLSVGGSVLGSGPYVDVSDARLKKNIHLIPNHDIMKKMNHLQAISYDLNEDLESAMLRPHSSSTPDSQRRQQIGFIAQEVRAIFPELVSERPDGYLGVQYSRFVPLLIEAMKDVDARIRKMEEENNSLRKMIQGLLQEE